MKNLSRSILSFVLVVLSLQFSTTLLANPANQKQQPVVQTEEMPAQVNINNATVEELVKHLNGIGINKAKKIVEYRETFGPFVTIEQLREVSGIGQSILDKNIGLISL